jgi:branched-chain amino acid transport system permease protein
MAERTKAAGDRAWSRVLGLTAHLPIRQIIQWILVVLIVIGVVYGSWKTLTLPAGAGRFSGSAWRDLIVFGIAQGSIYALVAIGYSLVYGVLLMINFAHGEVFTAGAFASYFVASALAASGFLNSNPIPALMILFAVGMTVSMGVAVLLERVAYRPLRGAPRLVPLITAIGASLFLQNTFRGLFGPQVQGYPDVNVLMGRWTILGVPILRSQVISIVGAVIGVVGLSLFVARTKTGKSMRAVAEDKEIAALMGIDVNKVISKTFAIGGLLAGIAGVMFALVFSEVDPAMGFVPGIKAFTAAVLGGIGSIGGAALGGLILGMLESVGPFLFLQGAHIASPNQLKDVIAFSILVLVLLFRPGGILGTGEAEKV